MSSKAESGASALDTVKLTAALVLVIAGAVAFHLYSEQALLFRVLGILAVVAVALGIALTTFQGRNAWSFVKDARTEVRKVVWPTRAETVQTTLVVMIMVVIVAILLWIMDSFLLWAVRWLTGQGN